MKKLFSLVALVFVLSSFSLKSSKIEKVIEVDWDIATSAADSYGGSYSESWAIWDHVYSSCSSNYYGVSNCSGC